MSDPIPTFPTRLPGELWGIITHVNPAGYRDKIANLTRCIEGVRAQGLRVPVVELAFDDDPFHVPETLCEHVERRRTRTVLWQKVGDDDCWAWSSDRPSLHSRVRDYFAARREE